MFSGLESYRRLCRVEYSPDDLTMIIGVRCHAGNPWVMERVDKLSGYYQPGCRVVLVDFGSQGAYAEDLARACEGGGLTYHRVDDPGVYSASAARNAGVALATTDLLFLNDIDCFGPRDLIGRVVAHANAIDLGACIDQIINMPLYHLGARQTEVVMTAPGADSFAQAITRAQLDSVYGATAGEVTEFVDPFSNMFVCHRDFYDLIGGFNEAFRGHGSEDFEMILRAVTAAGQLPIPDAPGTDEYGPVGAGFYGPKAYRGFRRLGELLALPTELSGLRLCHLHHPRSPKTDDWYRQADGSRVRFSEQTGYLRDPNQLAWCDWMPRTRRAAAWPRGDRDWQLLLPLRWAGYRLCPGDSPDVDACVVLPGQDRDDHIRVAVDRATENDQDVVRVQPGPMPGSYRYGLGHEPPRDFARAASSDDSLTDRELAVAREAMADSRFSLPPSTSGVDPVRAAAFALFRWYSFFGPAGVFRFSLRRHVSVLRAQELRPYDPSSYAAGRLGVNIRQASGGSDFDHLSPRSRMWKSLPFAEKMSRRVNKLNRVLRTLAQRSSR